MSVPTTLPAAFQETVAGDPEAVALRTVGGTQTVTWQEYDQQVRLMAAGFAHLGVGRGDTVALMMANRIEFYPVDVAAQHLGACSFSVYNTLSAEQLGYVLGNSAPKVVVAEAQYADRIRGSGAAVDHLVVLDGTVDDAITLKELLEAGRSNTHFDFDGAWQSVEPSDVVTLIYTSGTTGNPKGVEMTHANLLFEAATVRSVLPVERGDRITSFLPSAHIADRFTALYLQQIAGTQVTVVPDPKQVAAALPDVRPTIWGAVPRVWEKLKAGIEGIRAANPDLTPEQIRTALGLGELKWAISGAAPIAAPTLEFFVELGIPIAEIWGMSELSCIASGVRPDEHRTGTVGRIMPGMEARLAEDGELLVRGPLVMKGYRNEPEKTAEAVDAEGWLHTGDVATIDDDGYISIVDRKKELIINQAGKNISPANVENALKPHIPLAAQVVAIGDGRPYITALVVLDADAAAAYAAQHGIEPSAKALSSDARVVEAIRAGVADGNEHLSRVEQIKRFRVVEEFWEPGGDELTPTMKLKRRPIASRYAPEIDELYAAELRAGVLEPALAAGSDRPQPR